MTQRFQDVTRDLLTEGYAVRFHAPGSSMAPAIRDGDVIVIVPAAHHHIEIGDIALFQTPTGLRAHRLTARAAAGDLIFRGDAAPDADAPVRPESVLGKVVSVERTGKRGILSQIHRKLVSVTNSDMLRGTDIQSLLTVLLPALARTSRRFRFSRVSAPARTGRL